jgi:hypothetical protein
MSENKTNDTECEICNNSIVLFSISLLVNNIKNAPRILCPRCLMADQLAMFELTKINFPGEIKAIKELTSLLLEHKKEKNEEFLAEAREMATKGTSDE